MSNFGKNQYNFLFKICSSNISGPSPLFHTSRNFVFPFITRGEKNCAEYLRCLRPVKMPISDAPTLAGEPRTLDGNGYVKGIDPEIYEKWNRTTKVGTRNGCAYSRWNN